jgi:hypothetical protein
VNPLAGSRGITPAALVWAVACAASLRMSISDDPLKPLMSSGDYPTTLGLLFVAWPGLYLAVAALVRPGVPPAGRRIGAVLAMGASLLTVLASGLAMLLMTSGRGHSAWMALPLALAVLHAWFGVAALRMAKELGLNRWAGLLGTLAVSGVLAVVWIPMMVSTSARRDVRPTGTSAVRRLIDFGQEQRRHAESHGGAHPEPAALDPMFASRIFDGYRYAFHRGPAGDWAYVAVPVDRAARLRAYCIDATDVLRSRADGLMTDPRDGRCPPDADPEPEFN